jgi:anti-sigma factor RsiW
MKTLTCAAARRSLQAFHDSELPVSQEIAVWAHLEWCDGCAAALAELQLVRAALLVATQERGTLAREAASFNATVVNRLKAERTPPGSPASRDVRDMRLKCAGGCRRPADVCVVICWA